MKKILALIGILISGLNVFTFAEACNPFSDTVNFYENTGKYYEFTNFWACPVSLKACYNSHDIDPKKDTANVRKLVTEGLQSGDTERLFQALKFLLSSKIDCSTVCSLKTARNAFDFARNNLSEVNPGWHSHKLYAMYAILVSKFALNSDLSEILRKTGSKQICEHTKNDTYWGDNLDGSGHNYLGKLLEIVRFRLFGLPVSNQSVVDAAQELHRHRTAWIHATDCEFVDPLISSLHGMNSGTIIPNPEDIAMKRPAKCLALASILLTAAIGACVTYVATNTIK